MEISQLNPFVKLIYTDKIKRGKKKYPPIALAHDPVVFLISASFAESQVSL
jgi:hypothetical protein